MGQLIHKQYIHTGRRIPFLKAVQNMTELPVQTCNNIIAKGGAYHGKLRCKDPHKTIVDSDFIQAYYRLPFKMERIPFQKEWILEKNDQFLLTCKPKGIPTQGRRDGDSMAFYEILKQNTEGYLGLHHRLDQDTSGLMLFCRQKKLNVAFARLFQDRLIKKSYIALCSGEWTKAETKLEVHHPLGRLPSNKGSGAVFGKMASGKKAHTTLELIGQANGQMLIQATPHTGRTHQIRIHSALEGFPLIGDDLYGSKGVEPGFLLHAFHLSWPSLNRLNGGFFHVLPGEDWKKRLSKPLIKVLNEWSRTCQEN